MRNRNKYSLPHDNDPLADNEKILTNVEPVISEHPDRFHLLRILFEAIAERKARCFCGFIVRREDLRYYPQKNGLVNIPYEEDKCWVYSHCPSCGYDLSFPKILKQMEWH